jgi:Cu+-exporting ATPase
MFRRHFMRGIALAGSGGLASIGNTEAGESRTVTYRIEGFSCVTCAVGLETMLRLQRGIVRAKASYPDAKATIEFGLCSRIYGWNGLGERCELGPLRPPKHE